MGNRSGKRLPSYIKKADRRYRQKVKKRQKQIDREYERRNAPSSTPIPPGYLKIHLAIKDYIQHYLNANHSQKSFDTLVPGLNVRSLYVRKPINDLDILLDVFKIEYRGDECTLTVRFFKSKDPNDSKWVESPYLSGTWNSKTNSFLHDERYGYLVPQTFRGTFANPNFFPDLRVFLDKCLSKYWGDSYTSTNLLKLCVVNLEKQFTQMRVVEIKKSKGSLDEPSVFDVQINGSSRGVLFILDGYVLFQNHRTTIQKTVSWVAGCHIYDFCTLVCKEISNDYSSGSNSGLYSATQKTE